MNEGIADGAGDGDIGVKSLKILDHVKEFGLYPKDDLF